MFINMEHKSVRRWRWQQCRRMRWLEVRGGAPGGGGGQCGGGDGGGDLNQCGAWLRSGSEGGVLGGLLLLMVQLNLTSSFLSSFSKIK